MRDLRGDIRDLDALRGALDAADAEIIIHMAAQSLVRRSYREPLETFATGLRKTVRWYLDNPHWWQRIRSGVYRGERLGTVA